ncbi:small acid-soluble spore protein Tlp [Schnuerera sp. xch1]|uniref:small acid-soluble spore protein Tlp n=1 Tax=Schnuerera sp. xch1 TaxID=2874283 RepID=UPI001CBE9CFA|nr:small acid-soluble spore protein Tlp [Schnuerera sp. xch1]MBZ2174764.1 small acid-soluble spore protein Tlp [Schnuerera sp. xch1]
MKKSPKSNPDDRRDNVDKIQFKINKTIQNYELAEEMIAKTDDEKTKEELKEKNKRRLESLKSMRHEIRDEAIAKEKGYKDRK